MTWRRIGYERDMPPGEFQRLLTQLGGVNRYDEPNFVIWWGQYGHGHGSFRSGGSWSVDEAHFEGYRDILRGSGEPCWCLGQFHEAIEYGTPESYYVQYLDEATGLQQLGEFPYSGRVELLYNLRWHEMEDGKLSFHTMPLSTWTFELVIPIIVKAKEISMEKRKEAYIQARKRDEDEKVAEIERHLRDKALPFTGAVSYGRQGIRSTVIDKKMAELQRTWAQAANAAKSFKTGLQIR